MSSGGRQRSCHRIELGNDGRIREYRHDVTDINR